MIKLKNYDFSMITFWASSLFVVFLLGGVFHSKAWQPYLFFKNGFDAVLALVEQQLQTRPVLLLEKKYSGSGVVRHIPDRTFPGLTLVQGLFPEGVELRLIDMSGNVVHRWSVDFFRIWPNPKHIVPKKNIPVGQYNYHTQGMQAFPDGSVVFNVAEKGTAKLGKCGEIQWTIDRMTHHSITLDPDGSLWIPAKGDVSYISSELLFDNFNRKHLLESHGWYEDRILKIAANGKIEREISVLVALFEADMEKELYDASLIDAMDPTHLNDIEIVTSTLSQKIEGIEKGDLLISLRQMHMLAILDRKTGKLKWHHTGPWIRQHDPDITAQGTIEVFNNRPVTSSNYHGVGSNIISFDPHRINAQITYPISNHAIFYTDIMGTHQILANGNRLITESRAGRIFEVDQKGNIVWEFLETYDETYAALIESAIRYDRNFFSVKDWDC
ncbi:MAG: arylsulfotransferase family protein [Candidatus Thiodiazotropha endolucinida]